MPRTDPLARVTTTVTPQTQPIPGREADMIRNSAGGYSFTKDSLRKVEDFLILGTTGGTYYCGEDKLTVTNVGWLAEAIQAGGVAVVNLIRDISASRPPRAPKNRPAVYALAQVFATGDAAAVQAAKAVFADVVRTTDHLSMFTGYYKAAKGKATGHGTALVTGRAVRTAMASWFLAGDADSVAWKALKARQRKTPQGEDLTLRDVLRVAHPKAGTPERAALLRWLAGKDGDDAARSLVPALDRFLITQAVTREKEAVKAVTDLKVPWEYLPSQFQSSPAVWEALAPHVGMTALIRNLARMTRMGVLAPFAAANDVVVRRLTDQKALNGARIHPMDLFLALLVYREGHSQPHLKAERQTWSPVPAITDALEAAYDLSFASAVPSGKKMLVAVDCSGSMGAGVSFNGTLIGSAYNIGNAMAVILARIEGGNVHVIDFGDSVHASRVTARTNLREIPRWQMPGGGTDLSLPAEWARDRKLDVDGIVILSDMETWAGSSHPAQALTAYRRQYGRTRLVCAALTAAGHTVADTQDEDALNIAGVDAHLPRLVGQFVR